MSYIVLNWTTKLDYKIVLYYNTAGPHYPQVWHPWILATAGANRLERDPLDSPNPIGAGPQSGPEGFLRLLLAS